MNEAIITLTIGFLLGVLISDTILMIILSYKVAKLEEYTGINK